MRVIPIDLIGLTHTPMKVYTAIACKILQFGLNPNNKILLTSEENATAVDPRTLNAPVESWNKQ